MSGRVRVWLVQVFESVLVTIRDQRPAVREAAARALRACLFVIGERESRHRTHWYSLMFADALGGLRERDSNASHGALLAMAELLDTCDELDESALAEAFRRVWPFKESRLRHVRHAVLAVLPRLAARTSSEASEGWVAEILSYLVGALRLSTEYRGALFIATGRMALAVGAAFEPHIPAVIRECRDALTLGSSKSFASSRPGGRQPETEALQCISMLVQAHSAAVAPHIVHVLPCMCSCGLSSALTASLTVVVAHLPALLAEIQCRLLDLVSCVLTRHKYQQWLEHVEGMRNELPTNELRAPSEGAMARSGMLGWVVAFDKAHEPTEQRARAEQMVLALETVGGFDLRGCKLHMFACHCVSHYLDDGSEAVRRAAAKACCNILLSSAADRGDANLAAQVRWLHNYGEEDVLLDLIVRHALGTEGAE